MGRVSSIHNRHFAAGLAAFATVFLASWAAMPAHEKSEGGSYVTAFACGDLPKRLSVQVISTDDSDDALALRKHLIATLRTRGISVDPKARLRLTVEVTRKVDAAPARKPDLVELSRRDQEPVEGGPGGGYETRVEVNIWSSRKDSLIGGRTSGKTGRVVDQLRMEITINDLNSGACLWKGTAFHDLAGRDLLREAKRVAGPLVRRIGKKAAHEPFVAD